MAAFRCEENWNHTATLLAATYQAASAEKDKVFYPQQFHPDYEAVGEAADGNQKLGKDAVPQKMVFGLLKNTIVGK